MTPDPLGEERRYLNSLLETFRIDTIRNITKLETELKNLQKQQDQQFEKLDEILEKIDCNRTDQNKKCADQDKRIGGLETKVTVHSALFAVLGTAILALFGKLWDLVFH